MLLDCVCVCVTVYVSWSSTTAGQSSTLTCCWFVTTVDSTMHLAVRCNVTATSSSASTWTNRQRSPLRCRRSALSQLTFLCDLHGVMTCIVINSFIFSAISQLIATLPIENPEKVIFEHCCSYTSSLIIVRECHQDARPGVHLVSPGLLQLTAVRHQRRTTSMPAVGAERCRPPVHRRPSVWPHHTSVTAAALAASPSTRCVHDRGGSRVPRSDTCSNDQWSRKRAHGVRVSVDTQHDPLGGSGSSLLTWLFAPIRLHNPNGTLFAFWKKKR